MANQLLFGNVFALRKQRVYRDRIELATLSDRQIRSRFRFKRESIQFISDLLRNDLSHTTRRSQPISVEMQVNSNGQINLGSEDSKKEKGIAPLAYMIIIGDAIHNTTDGLVLGAAFSSDIADGIGLTIAIFCHELPQELGDFAVLITSGLSFCQAIWANLFSSLTAFIGFFVGVQVASYATAVNWIYAVTAGNFLYIALVDMLPELMKLGSKSWKTFCYHNIGIVTGALILVVVAVFEEHIEV